MKKTVIVLFAFCLGLSSALAFDFEVDGIYYKFVSKSEGTVAITSNGNDGTYSGEVYLPDNALVNYGGTEYKIVEIGEGAFKECTKLNSVNIPNGILTIGDDAFRGCTSITTMEIPSTTTVIGNSAFQSCKLLKNIKGGNNIIEIKSAAFNGCEQLNDFKLPETLEYIRGAAFASCKSYDPVIPQSIKVIERNSFLWSSISKIEIPEGFTTIEEATFDGCSKLRSVKLPSTLILIKDNAFSYCSLLKNIELPNTLKEIGSAAFNSSGLTSINLPEGLEKIGYNAFGICKDLKSINIPSSVKVLERQTFDHCYNLSEVKLNEGLLTIEERAFCYCTSLQTITIPSTVNFIDYTTTLYQVGVFQDCYNLKEINVDKENIYYHSINGVLYDATYKKVLDCPQKYEGTISLPEGLEEIGDFAFKSCDKLSEITLPKSLKFIGDDALSYTTLKKITSNAEEAPICYDDDVFFFTKFDECILIVKDRNKYLNEEGWKNFKYIYDGTLPIDIEQITNDWDWQTSVSGRYVEVGETFQAKCIWVPHFATRTDLIWTSSDENIATVSPEGLITVKSSIAPYIFTITAQAKYNPNASLTMSFVVNPTSAIDNVNCDSLQRLNIKYDLSGRPFPNNCKINGISISNHKKRLK